MLDVASSLQRALGLADERLAQGAQQAARSQTSLGQPVTDATMASLAQGAIFSEALLSAMHARLEEIKSVTK